MCFVAAYDGVCHDLAADFAIGEVGGVDIHVEPAGQEVGGLTAVQAQCTGDRIVRVEGTGAVVQRQDD